MKKRWIPFAVLCMAMIFIFGQLTGATSEADRQQTQQQLQSKMSTTIAVVNADAGMSTEKGKLNYSAAIIDTLGDNFVLVSSVMAYNGYANGTYGAVVTFPSDVSAKILAFNSKDPEKVQLEFQVNPNLPEKDYLETYIAIMELQLSINTTLANTYVSSIYDQFHLAQDQVSEIFQNDKSDLSALDIVRLKEFTDGLELDYLPEISLDPDKADTTRYMNDVNYFADSVSGLYLNSYELASSRYIPMREGLFQMTEDFPEQEEEWLSRLSDWTTISVDYGKSLEEYSAAVNEHEEELVAWYLENVAWQESLTEYQSNVANWQESLNVWFGEAGDWYTEYQSYLDAAVEYMEEVSDYRVGLSETAAEVMEDLNAWKEQIEEDGKKLFEEIADSYTDYNAYLSVYQSGLKDYQDTYAGFESDLYSYKATLNEIYAKLQELEEQQAEITFFSDDPDDPIDPDDNTPSAIEELYILLDSLDTDISSFIYKLEELPDLDELEPVEPPKLEDLDQWGDTGFIFTEYEGGEIPDEDDLAEKFPEPGTSLPEVSELEEAKDYEGSDMPETVDENNPLTVEQPYNPMVDAPPKPDNFWSSLNQMHDQLSSFEIDDYLSDDIKQQVATLLNSYEAYLDTVRDDLSLQFEGNVSKMYEMQYGYTDYLATLRTDALEAETSEQEKLQSTLDEYATIKQQNSEDTQDRLSDFASMMPDSRSPAGLNRNLVGFTVAPFDFSPPALRQTATVDTSSLQPLSETYQKYLWIIIPVVGGVFLLTILSSLFTYFRRKQRKHAETIALDLIEDE